MTLVSITEFVRRFRLWGLGLIVMLYGVWLFQSRNELIKENARIKQEARSFQAKLDRHKAKTEEIAFRLLRLEATLESIHHGARTLDKGTAMPIRGVMNRTKFGLIEDESLMRLVTEHRLFGENRASGEDYTAFSRMLDATTKIEVNLKEMYDELNRLAAVLPARLKVLAHIPTQLPVTGKISSAFGMRNSPLDNHKSKHLGMDIANDVGTPIRAPADGVVRSAHRYGSFGKYISIVHTDDLTTRFAHLDDIRVERGDKVKRGQIIGTMGNTGRSTGPHLHYEIQYKGRSVNPHPFIDLRQAGWKTLAAHK